jgi:hypothetical protein
MQVFIIEKNADSVVAIVPLTVQGLNYSPNENECFDLAWQTAVEDNLVDPNQRVKYKFEIKS